MTMLCTLQEDSAKSFYKMSQLESDELDQLLRLARRGKSHNWSDYSDYLKGKVIGLLFLNKSLRTRASFYAGIARLGGTPMELNIADSYVLESRIGVPMTDAVEHAKEAVRVISRYVDALCIRSFSHPNPEDSWEDIRKDEMWNIFKSYTTVPLINMESALWHPCQSLADAFTLKEQFDDVTKRKFVLSWAPHPRALCMAVPNSTLAMACQLGMQVTLACPEGYELDDAVMQEATHLSERYGGSLQVEHDQAKAFEGADVVYAKSWSPPKFIGRFEEEQELRKSLGNWQISDDNMRHTNDGYFMHCLPVRRNIVVSDSVIDSKKSLVIEQAENRMHAQNALMLRLFNKW